LPDTGLHVVCGNNYSLTSAWADWTAGLGPAQQLWGTAALRESGCSLSLVPVETDDVRQRLSRRLGYRLGDIGCEQHALRLRRPDSVLYSAAPSTFAGLAWLRARRLLSNPVVAVVHPTSFRGRGLDTGLRGYDHVIALSRVVYEELVHDMGRAPSSTTLLPWGPELGFVGYRATGDDYVVCSGKTQRDHGTLLRALAGTDLEARLHTRTPMPTSGSAVTVATNAPYAQVLQDLQRASIVAIPLATVNALAGITELNDALALAKPVVMTRTRYVDVDIEAIGCGIWVDPGDVEGWRAALVRLSRDPGLRHEMGQRGRAYAEEHHNADAFGRGVVKAVAKAAERR
jgi:hypothetical protein